MYNVFTRGQFGTPFLNVLECHSFLTLILDLSCGTPVPTYRPLSRCRPNQVDVSNMDSGKSDIEEVRETKTYTRTWEIELLQQTPKQHAAASRAQAKAVNSTKKSGRLVTGKWERQAIYPRQDWMICSPQSLTNNKDPDMTVRGNWIYYAAPDTGNS